MEHVNARIIRNKLGLLNLAQELGNVSKACKIMGLSRDTFYRYQNAVEAGGVEALVEKSRRKPNQKNRTDEATEAAVVAFALEYPAYGQVRASNELRKQGVFISPSGVRCVWLRHDLARFKQRLAALERKMAESGGMVLTEAQVAALERKREDDLACGEIETAHPGYLGSQDTFYVGTLEGRGSHLPADLRGHLLEMGSGQALHHEDADHLSRSAQRPGAAFLRRPGHGGAAHPDRSRHASICGKAEQHDYELFLAVNDIEHTKTKAHHPQTNGICERFHKTILQEFYQVGLPQEALSDHWRSCSRTWTRGSSATTPNAHMKARCVAGAPLGHYACRKGDLGRKSSRIELNMT